MSPLFQKLPGIPLPVKEVTEQLAHMWDAEAAPGHEAPSEFRASQMNLVLHYGLSTTPEEAQERFETSIAFARRYPCRIIVLCPAETEDPEALLQGKLFSQCYVGEAASEMTCCEVLMLGYPVGQSGFLENQISVWLEPDLPVYHWLHRVPRERVESVYRPFLESMTRVMYDRQVDGAAYDGLCVADCSIRDLAYARTLPMRQVLGQFLSGTAPVVLVEGLREVAITHGEKYAGEALGLLAWFREALDACADVAGKDLGAVEFETQLTSSNHDVLRVTWSYEGTKRLHWERMDDGHAHLEADFGHGATTLHQNLRALSPREALAEALFF